MRSLFLWTTTLAALALPSYATVSLLPIGPYRSYCALALSQAERDSFLTKHESGQLIYPLPFQIPSLPLTGRKADAKLENGNYLSVLTDSDEWFTAHWELEFTEPRLKHWSFTGGPVKWAGVIQVTDGVISVILNDSGSYLPGIAHMLVFLDYLEQNRVPVSDELELYFRARHFPTGIYPHRDLRFFPVAREALSIPRSLDQLEEPELYARALVASLQTPSKTLGGRTNQVLAALSLPPQHNEARLVERVNDSLAELIATRDASNVDIWPTLFVLAIERYSNSERATALWNQHPELAEKWRQLKELMTKK